MHYKLSGKAELSMASGEFIIDFDIFYWFWNVLEYFRMLKSKVKVLR